MKKGDRVKHKKSGRLGEVREVEKDAWNVRYAIVWWENGYAVSAINLSLLEVLK